MRILDSVQAVGVAVRHMEGVTMADVWRRVSSSAQGVMSSGFVKLVYAIPVQIQPVHVRQGSIESTGALVSPTATEPVRNVPAAIQTNATSVKTDLSSKALRPPPANALRRKTAGTLLHACQRRAVSANLGSIGR
jgi:hypothetical protein